MSIREKGELLPEVEGQQTIRNSLVIPSPDTEYSVDRLHRKTRNGAGAMKIDWASETGPSSCSLFPLFVASVYDRGATGTFTTFVRR